MNEVNKVDLASQAYLSWKGSPSRRYRKKQASSGSAAFEKGNKRDPIKITSVIDDLSKSWGWKSELEVAAIISNWQNIVGDNVAQRTKISAVSNGIITVECTSTSWATELRRIRAEIITKIMTKYPDSEIRDMKFIVTGVPSWNHGFRSVKGKGPRDTYK